MVEVILELLLNNLSSLIQAEIGSLWGVQEDMEKLSRTLETIQLVIEVAETKQSTDKMIAHWLTKLKNAAYDADDVLDEWSTELQLSQRRLGSKSRIKQVSRSLLDCFPLNQVVFRHKIASKIAKFNEQFEDISLEMSTFGFMTSSGRGGERGGALLDPTRETSSMVHEPQVYGRDEDKDKIVDMLIGSASGQNDVSFLAILGSIGGLGKTTLAQLVFNDELVCASFEEKIWVCVSEDFTVQRLIKLIIESLSGGACDLTALGDMQKKLKGLLSGKRYLLVLDDVWNEDQEKWNKLKCSLTTCGAKGSSIIVTTRLEGVASIMHDASSLQYHLSPLSEDECWNLFRGSAFAVGEDMRTDLMNIGKQIVSKCKGVPLAAKVLGCLMRFKREVGEWESIRDDDLWKLPEKEGGAIFGVLRLSYYHLRPQLKQCFSYCAIFPKDYQINKEELVQMWMANGFIRPANGIDELEGIGNQVFNELVQGLFFQDVEEDMFGDIVKCKMHDLMHDLACHLTESECCTIKIKMKDTTFPRNRRHMLLTDKWWELSSSSWNSLYRSNKSLHTLAFRNRNGFEYFNINLKRRLNYLRVLDLSLSMVQQSQISIGHMKCLRYLDLSYGWAEFLPESICGMLNLQTLKLVECKCLKKLPKDMKNLTQLRHLDIRGCHSLSKTPSKIGQLTCLRTLSIFIVGEKNGTKINELKELKHLGGELKLRRLELVKDSTEARESKLVCKQNLSSLALCWGYEDLGGGAAAAAAEEVLEYLQPHSGVKELAIKGFPGTRLPSWMKSLPNVVKLELSDCVGFKTLPPLGQLPRLKFLTVCKMDSLEYIGNEFYGEGGADMEVRFPSLEKFFLYEMPNLEIWEGRYAEFPNLREFKIRRCPKLERPGMLPNWMKLQSLRISDMMVLPSLRNLHALTALYIHDMAELVSFPEGSLQNLSALKSLSIESCNKLKSIPDEIGYLTALTSLEICGCDNLISLPDEIGHLTALTSLKICGCDNLISLPDEIGHLTALTSLEIRKCDKFLSLPDKGLQKLTSLNLTSLSIWLCDSPTSLPAMGIQGVYNSLLTLEIMFFAGLTCLDLQCLSSLQTLEVGGCDQLELSKEAFQHLISLRDLKLCYLPKMTSVPDLQNLTALKSLSIRECPNLGTLPEGLQYLTFLKSLEIYHCHPDLHRRIKKGKGEDWPKISRIPHRIDEGHNSLLACLTETDVYLFT